MKAEVKFLRMEKLGSPVFEDENGAVYFFPESCEPKGANKNFWDQLGITSQYVIYFKSVGDLSVITEIHAN